MSATSSTPSMPGEPSAWVARYIAAAAPGGTVLDVACGSGRHLRLALDRGFSVMGVDRDLGGVDDLAGWPGVELIAADLECGLPPPWTGRRFAGVIVSRYLWRPLLPAITAAVAADGVLIYETFARGHERIAARPANPQFLLEANELAALAIAAGLVIIAFEHGGITTPALRCVQRLAAVGPAHDWAHSPHRAGLLGPA